MRVCVYVCVLTAKAKKGLKLTLASDRDGAGPNSVFNLYGCVVGERWISRVAEMEDVGSYLRYKFDQQLFRRYTRNASKIPSKKVSLQMM